MIEQLMNIEIQPFDYQYLVELLKRYKYPRNKISKLIANGDIIPLKQGLYILAKKYRKPLVLELAANLIYGPSYISLDYALSYYGLIPEKAYNITSVTSVRYKKYQTNIGVFVYRQLKPDYYRIGFKTNQREGISYLIAYPEKALCDKLYLAPSQNSISNMEQLLFEDLRISSLSLKELNSEYIRYFSKIAKSKNIDLLRRVAV